MAATESALAAAVDAALTTAKVTYLRTDVTHPARTELGTRYDVVVRPAVLHVPADPPHPVGAPPGAAVLRGGSDLDAPAG
ncbi:hypothetical protein GCM10028784_04260 [Myceligenerans cantabricum]